MARLLDRFCRCIKAVRKTIKARPGQGQESAAIAICVRSVIQRKGKKTLKRFRCTKKPFLVTQNIKRR